MKKVLLKRIGGVALALVLCALSLTPAYAENYTGRFDEVKDRKCSLTMTYSPGGEPLTDLNVRIWKVAEVSATGYLPKDDIWGYHVLEGTSNWPAKASTLYGYMLRDKRPATAEGQTDEDGRVTFEELEKGLYLVTNEQRVRGRTIYRATPFLICLPNTQDLNTWQTAVETVRSGKLDIDYNIPVPPPGPSDGPSESGEPDASEAPGTETIQRHVLKSWDDEDHEYERPDEVVVDLLRDGEVYDTATLTAQNSWRWDWTDLDARYDWRVVEREDDQYAVLVQQEGVTFQIINTWRELDDPGEEIEDSAPPQGELPSQPVDPNDPPEEQPWDPLIPGGDLPNPPGPGEGDPGEPKDPSLPQTGQLWWPVVPLAIAGVVLLLIGGIRRGRWSRNHAA